MGEKKLKKNIILLGDGAVGKTSLIRRYVIDDYSDDYIQTIGTKVTKKEIPVEYKDEEHVMTMMIWDIIGQKGFKYTQSLSLRDVNGALLVADLTRKESLTSLLSYWIPLVLRNTGPIPMVFLGNKDDLKGELEFGLDEIKDVAKNCEAFGSTMISYLTSAKTGNNVEQAFIDTANEVKGHKKTIKFDVQWDILDIDEIKSLTHLVDHVVADFADQFGGIEHATPFIKHQLKRSGLDLSSPTEPEIEKFIEYLATIEGGYKTGEVVLENKDRRLKLFRALLES